MKEKDLQKLVIQEFSTEAASKGYLELAKTGLWKSEEILIKKYFNKNKKVLDIGCGAGRTTIPLKKMSYDVIGVDITPKMIENAKKLTKDYGLNIRYKIMNAIKLNFKNESFDNALFSFNGWSQIPGKNDRLKALKEVYRVLKPEGYFIFTAHIRNYFSKYFFFWIGQWIKQYLVKPIGFKIDELEYGDRFFIRDSVTEMYKEKQYVHIPSLNEVKKQIKQAGFNLIFYDRRNNIAKQDAKLKSGNCMFYVCQK